jgi:delta(3,5)-delta(2,4)-dienoyl-CoA isomerase
MTNHHHNSNEAINTPLYKMIPTLPNPLNQQLQLQHLTVSTTDKHPHVVIVSLNRPRKRNAIHSLLWKEIGRLFSTLGRTGDDLRAVLLMGEGAAFCAGIDYTDSNFLPQSSSNNNNDTDNQQVIDVAHVGITFLPKLQHMQDCFTAVEQCPLPVVAAVHGQCIGAGVDLISCANIRCCTYATIFSVREVVLGLAADVGTLQRLPKISGNQSLVYDVCLTGRDFTAREAQQLGLVSHVAPSQEALYEYGLNLCASMAQYSPVAVQGTKAALLYARDHSVPDGLHQISQYNAMALQSRDVSTAWKMVANSKQKNGSTSTTISFPNIPAHSKL